MNIALIGALLVLTVLVLAVARLVVRKNGYATACLILVSGLGLVCTLFGLRRWFLTDSINAVLLAAVGMAALIAVTVVLGIPRKNRPGGEQPPA